MMATLVKAGAQIVRESCQEETPGKHSDGQINILFDTMIHKLTLAVFERQNDKHACTYMHRHRWQKQISV